MEPAVVPPTIRSTRARVPLQHDGLFARAVTWLSRRLYGEVLDPAGAMLNNRRVLLTDLRHERSLARWKALDPDLRALAEMASASSIGCSWCIDFGHYLARTRGLDVEALREVPTWRTSTRLTPLQRDVIAYAEAMTATPPTVTDDLVAALRDRLGDAALVELTMMVAVENQRSRFNAALGLRSQGLSDRCEVPR